MQEANPGGSWKTVNEIVGLNLRRARQARGLTQDQAATNLWQYLGVHWSKQTFSAAEQGTARDFSVNELIAMARAFEVPVSYFFEPPPEEPRVYTQKLGAVKEQSTEGKFRSMPIEMVDLQMFPAMSLSSDELREFTRGMDGQVLSARLRDLAAEVEKRS